MVRGVFRVNRQGLEGGCHGGGGGGGGRDTIGGWITRNAGAYKPYKRNKPYTPLNPF